MRTVALLVVLLRTPALGHAQQCLHDSNETPQEKERRGLALKPLA